MKKIIISFYLDLVKSILGEGHFSKVFKCVDTEYTETVAVKVIRAVKKYESFAKIEVEILNDVASRDPEKQLYEKNFIYYSTHQNEQ